MRRLGIASVALCLLLLGWPGPATAATFIAPDEALVYQIVNATRAEHGLGPLSRSGSLDQVARGQSVRMVERQDLFHNPNLGLDLTSVGLDWLWSGENVGVGPDVVAIHEAFVASPHHYENIVRPNYDHIGVGVVSSPAGGVYVTQVFAQLEAAPPAASSRPEPAATPSAQPNLATGTPPPSLPPSAPLPAPPVLDIVAIEGGVLAPTPLFEPVRTEAQR